MARGRKKVVGSEAPAGDPYQIKPIDGFSFRWVNPEGRTKKGSWGIWKPLNRSSELGEKVVEEFNTVVGPVNFGLTNVDSDYFYRAANSMLAFAPTEKVMERRAAMQEEADKRMRMVHNTEGAKLRHTYIQKDPELD